MRPPPYRSWTLADVTHSAARSRASAVAFTARAGRGSARCGQEAPRYRGALGGKGGGRRSAVAVADRAHAARSRSTLYSVFCRRGIRASKLQSLPPLPHLKPLNLPEFAAADSSPPASMFSCAYTAFPFWRITTRPPIRSPISARASARSSGSLSVALRLRAASRYTRAACGSKRTTSATVLCSCRDALDTSAHWRATVSRTRGDARRCASPQGASSPAPIAAPMIGLTILPTRPPRQSVRALSTLRPGARQPLGRICPALAPITRLLRRDVCALSQSGVRAALADLVNSGRAEAGHRARAVAEHG